MERKEINQEPMFCFVQITGFITYKHSTEMEELLTLSLVYGPEPIWEQQERDQKAQRRGSAFLKNEILPYSK